VSSFQLALAETFRPRVAVLLALADDHLDWHGDFDAYVAAKARVFEHQAGEDLLVYDGDDPVASSAAATAPARSVPVSSTERADAFHVASGSLCAPGGRAFAEIARMRRALPHDITNALAASAAALEVGATEAGVQDALAAYQTMPHRVALVGEHGGVQYVDDSKATNPHATLHAVAAFRSVVLLAGGRNKGIDLTPLRQGADHVRAVVAFGESAREVEAVFDGVRPVVVAPSMHDAVERAIDLAESGDVVLLSPACASFDAYANYGARGDDFTAEVHAFIARAEAASR
jgi:UDP-N-acetylmuramoylalanine--D-glutamate ligase